MQLRLLAAAAAVELGVSAVQVVRVVQAQWLPRVFSRVLPAARKVQVTYIVTQLKAAFAAAHLRDIGLGYAEQDATIVANGAQPHVLV